MNVTNRRPAVGFFFIAVAAVMVVFSGAQPAAASAELAASKQLVVRVPNRVVDDLVAAQRGGHASRGMRPRSRRIRRSHLLARRLGSNTSCGRSGRARAKVGQVHIRHRASPTLSARRSIR
jgi:hypothetical protein